MKVLFIDQIATVNYKYSFNLCNELKKNDINIDLIIDNKEDINESKVNTIKLFNTADKNASKVSKILNYINSTMKLINMIRNNEYDIIHVQWFNISPIDYILLKKAKKTGSRIIVTIHDILPFNEKFYDFKYHKKIYDIADEIIVQAEANIKRFKELFPQDEGKLSYIPHGNFANYANIHDKREARKYLNLPQDKNILLFFGQIKKVKGLGVLIDAFNDACKVRDDIYLVIAGSVWGDDFSIYEDKIKKYKLEDKIRCDIRYIKDEEIEYYYSACDLNVLPYLDVYQSGVIQLAYAYKKAVIVTNIGAFTSIVTEGSNGFIAEPNDYESLRNAIIRACNNNEKLNEMGEEGNRFILENFSWNDISTKIFKLYNKKKLGV